MAIGSFKNNIAEAVNKGENSKKTQKVLPAELHKKAQVRMGAVGAATSLNDLKELRGNNLESLKGDREGQYSVKINDQYRICFEWRDSNAYEVEIADYH